MQVNSDPVACYFEAHIEQGPILEASEKVVGVVTAARGQRWYDIVLEGREAHAGPTPMETRKDAMVGASRIILEIDRIGGSQPNARSTVAGRVAFSGDLRHPEDATLSAMDAEFRRTAAEIADELGLALEISQRTCIGPLPFHPALVDPVRRFAREEGRPYQEIYTGAGHDACNIAKFLPTTMIFVPCEGGISHNEIETAKPEDLEAGCNVLCNAMRAVANGEVDPT